MEHDIVVIGASAGGIEALRELCAGLPASLPAAVLVAQHIAPNARSLLPEVLARAGPLPAGHVLDGEPIRPGRIYVAPPDRHLLVAASGDRLLVRRGPHENRTRPAADPLFRSAAVACRSRVVGVVLSGALDDGTAGLVAIKRCGGISVVQDPEEALWPDMPRNALEGDSPDYRARLADLPALLDRLARSPAGLSPEPPAELMAEARIAEQEMASMVETIGAPSPLSCPDCGGVLNEVHDGKLTRFRCQIGHAYAPESLAAAQDDALEQAMAVALRTHRERLTLFERMEAHARERGLAYTADRWWQAAREAEQCAALITKALERLRAGAAPRGRASAGQ